MDVKFVTSDKNLIDTVPIVDGQILTASDSSAMFYDMNETRRRVGPCMWLPMQDPQPEQMPMIKSATESIIELDTNGGSDIALPGSSSVNILRGSVGDKVPLSDIPTPMRTGYRFLGWYENQTYSEHPVTSFPDTFKPGRTIYYASWVKD